MFERIRIPRDYACNCSHAPAFPQVIPVRPGAFHIARAMAPLKKNVNARLTIAPVVLMLCRAVPCWLGVGLLRVCAYRCRGSGAALFAAAFCFVFAGHAYAVEMDDAFAAVPLRAGSFDFLPLFALRAGYTDNAARSAGSRQSSALSILDAGLEARSDWLRHAARGGLRGRYTTFSAGSAFDDAAFSADADLRLDVGHADEWTLAAAYDFEREDRVDDYVLTAQSGYLHRFNRLSLRLSAGIDDFTYGTRSASLGSTARDNVADYTQFSGALRLAYSLPTDTELFVESSANRRRFDRRIDADGLRQGSDGFGLFAGLSIDSRSKLRGSAALGYRVQRPDEDMLKQIDALVVDTNLVWDVSALTTLEATITSDIGETTLAGASGYVTWQASFGATHALRRNILLSAELTYERNDFRGSNLAEQSVGATIGAAYSINPGLALTSEIAFLAFDSSASGADYHATTVMLGVEARP